MEKQSFHYVFQISKTINFNVSYYRLGSNQNKYFTTSADEFNRPKTDFIRCGQAQKDLLVSSPLAMSFYNRYDELHLKDLSEIDYNSILIDIEKLKNAFNYIEKIGIDSSFGFSSEKELSKLPLKKIKK
jgi:hypothetical protein